MSSRRDFILKTGLVTGFGLIDQSVFAIKNDYHVNFNHIKPKRISPGDTVAIISPAGAVWDELQVDKFSAILKSFGFNVVFGNTLKNKSGYLAGSDAERASEINSFFGDKNIKGLFCMKGGWGCARILDQIDYENIKNNPKVLIGFSDITSLLNAVYAKTGLITFHGPVGNSGWNDFTSSVFESVIMKGEKMVFPKGVLKEDNTLTIREGTASGVLTGGNLSVLASMIGTGYIPDWNGKILFLEETKEEPYRIDRMITQLKMAGVLKSLNGIVIGKFVKCEAEEPNKAFTFIEVLEQHLQPLGIPVYYGGMTGHIENKWTLPIGINVFMNANEGTLQMTESAVL